ncbi:alpha/beta fold hydrolase [Dictyobacter formicarum]|uniref:Alpha/beta hydrolase n=1 Tax=Dictyobacter formicarum TaxID=2778368 RepID=A0ABQ3VBU8_9CHLR|nr:alpha/beta hydrolase [Dictyobacter formicarum]GHO83138.1 alpha/beta hydrolase [Dictyobacter formicarum]
MNTINNTANIKPGRVQSGRVITEGDELYYEVRGQGQPFLIIAAGEGKYYTAVADLLADEYKVTTYDRRANGRSTMNNPQNFEISQQSRDAVAVLHAAGETSAFVFGNSAGAVIALDMAKTQPQAVRAVVAHEAPLARVLPEARKWQRFFASIYMTAFRFSSSLATFQFMLGAQLPILQLLKASGEAKKHEEVSNEPTISEKDAADVQIKLELLPVTNYLPDVELIKQNGIKVFIAIGEWGLKKNAWYARGARILAGRLGCELVAFPGHHYSLIDMPNEWAVTLRRLLHQAETANR